MYLCVGLYVSDCPFDLINVLLHSPDLKDFISCLYSAHHLCSSSDGSTFALSHHSIQSNFCSGIKQGFLLAFVTFKLASYPTPYFRIIPSFCPTQAYICVLHTNSCSLFLSLSHSFSVISSTLSVSGRHIPTQL